MSFREIKEYLSKWWDIYHVWFPDCVWFRQWINMSSLLMTINRYCHSPSSWGMSVLPKLIYSQDISNQNLSRYVCGIWQAISKIYKMLKVLGLPWWHSGWESACQCRGHGFEPWSGKIPHAAEQLGPWATIAEPARLEPVLRSKRGHDSERPTHRDEEWPPLSTTAESPCTETKTQQSQK